MRPVLARDTGTYDSLPVAAREVHQTDLLRNAIPEWRAWPRRSLLQGSYFGVTAHYFFYLTETALDHARKGERLLAICAIWRAFAMFPSRALRKLLSDSALRDALIVTLGFAKVDRSSG